MEELQAHMQQLTLEPEEFVEQLPAGAKAAVEALRELQEKHDELEEEYEKERAALEAKYEKLYAPLYDERAEVVSGKKAVKLPEGVDAAEATKGIPDFWQVVFLRCDATRDIMNEKDVDVLRYLTNVTCETLQPEVRSKKKEEGEAAGEDEEEEEEATGGFRIQMTFAENPYFSNTVLDKTYHMLEGRDSVLERAEGTEIDWKPGKNVTMKLMKKKPKKGAKPDAKPQTKLEPVESFFNFFSPPEVPDEDADLDPDQVEMLEAEIEADYDIGDTIRRSLIPNAVGWYTGEALEDEEGGLFMGDEDEDEDEEGEDDEDEDDDSPPRPRRRGGRRAVGAAGAAGGENPECKQQ